MIGALLLNLGTTFLPKFSQNKQEINFQTESVIYKVFEIGFTESFSLYLIDWHFNRMTNRHVDAQVQQSSITSSLIRMPKTIVRKNIYCVQVQTVASIAKPLFPLLLDQ